MAVNIALGGSVFAYSGDTQWTPVLAQVADGAGLFAVEAYTFDRPIRYHLDYQTLRNHVHDLHAQRIVLTHMATSMLNRLTETDLPAAHDGMTIDI